MHVRGRHINVLRHIFKISINEDGQLTESTVTATTSLLRMNINKGG